MTDQSITVDQLARLYHARNNANSHLASAHRSGNKQLIASARADAKLWNKAYEAGLKQYKKQQKRERQAQLRTSMIRFYMDSLGV